MTIDVIVDENGDVMNEFTRDSIWNYHVWNEVSNIEAATEDIIEIRLDFIG